MLEDVTSCGFSIVSVVSFRVLQYQTDFTILCISRDDKEAHIDRFVHYTKYDRLQPSHMEGGMKCVVQNGFRYKTSFCCDKSFLST
jgi:hypothetical protein